MTICASLWASATRAQDGTAARMPGIWWWQIHTYPAGTTGNPKSGKEVSLLIINHCVKVSEGVKGSTLHLAWTNAQGLGAAAGKVTGDKVDRAPVAGGDRRHAANRVRCKGPLHSSIAQRQRLTVSSAR